MKAVILAGGAGSRLRPLSLRRPKPMVPLFDKPVLESILQLLRQHGITEICLTLHYQPEAIQSYFGDGKRFGVSLTYFLEEAPLGTAGSVKACADFLGQDEFLVLSGDGVCQIDLTACMDFHRQKQADATLLLHQEERPLEYGLVVTQPDGRITQFIEKPAWGQVCTSLVNTGIYLCNPRILDRVPPGEPCDFGKDLFPALLRDGHPLFGCEVKGYWCDIGDCSAYLRCMMDSLDGKTGVIPPAPIVAPGIWSNTPIPQDVTCIPPCYFGAHVSLGTAAQIGPYAAIGNGSQIGAGSQVEHSLLEQAKIGSRASVSGAILYAGAEVGAGAILETGAVLGENSVVGKDALVLEGSRIWPEQKIPDGARQSGTLSTAVSPGRLSFGDEGVLRGRLNGEITPEFCLALGNALGDGAGPIAVGFSGGSAAQNLANAIVCGIRSAGGAALRHDGGCEGAAVWLAQTGGYPRSVFVRLQGETVFLRCLGQHGRPLSRAQERALEGALLRGERQYAPQTGPLQTQSNIGMGYAQAAVSAAMKTVSVFRPFPVAVSGSAPETALLTQVFRLLDCPVGPAGPGIPAFHVSHGGLRLTLTDETGQRLTHFQVVTLLCQIAFRQGHGAVALPPDASAAAEEVAAPFGAQVLRLGRDGAAAEALYLRQPFLRDALFAAAHLCAYLGACKEPLSAVIRYLPAMTTTLREIPLRSSRGAVLEQLFQAAELLPRTEAEIGLRAKTAWGQVYLTPLIRRAAIRIISEGKTPELAAELCDVWTEKVRQADQNPVSC